MLAHIAIGTVVPLIFHGTERKAWTIGKTTRRSSAPRSGEGSGPTNKELILEAALVVNGDKYAKWLETVDEALLAETVTFPAPMTQKSRFEMLLGVKEHEMHHRAKLMLIERLLGIECRTVTRARQARS